jgi:hypothetical protein
MITVMVDKDSLVGNLPEIEDVDLNESASRFAGMLEDELNNSEECEFEVVVSDRSGVYDDEDREDYCDIVAQVEYHSDKIFQDGLFWTD